MVNCQTCGQPITATTRDAAWLLDLLTNGEPHREVYLGADGSWYVTYGGGGPVEASIIQGLVKQGLISPVYNRLPPQSYHIGRTLHIERTMAERQKHRRSKDAPKIYVGDPEPQQTSGA